MVYGAGARKGDAVSKHTPAPWLLEQQLGTDGIDCGWSALEAYSKPYRGEICHITDAEHIDGITKAERDANARLIAAAPELLGALRGMCSMWRTVCTSKGWEPGHVTQFVAAVEALSKATGEQP